jgi:chromate transporter
VSEAKARPASLLALYLAFNRLAIQGFGGVLAIAQRELVERLGWLSREEFVETLAIAQVLPGPNVVNLALMIGDRYFGLRGAMVALAGMLVMPFLVIIGLAAAYGELASQPVVVNALRGMGAVSAGLIIATALKLIPTFQRNPVGRNAALVLSGLTIIAIVRFQMPLPMLVLGLGGLGMAMAWRGLRR